MIKNVRISKSKYYEKEDLEELVSRIEGTPVEYVTDTLNEWLKVENRGEYLINILNDEDIRALAEYWKGD